MSDLTGLQGEWTFGVQAVRIDFADRWRVHRLLRKLGGCSVPYAAIAGVEFVPDSGRKRWRLRIRLIEGADPFAAGMLGDRGDKGDPFTLTGTADSVLTAEYHADQLRALAEGARAADPASDPAGVARSLVPAPPIRASTSEGDAVFDGSTVRLEWRRLARREKRLSGGRVLPRDGILRAEWTGPDAGAWAGVRFVLRDSAARVADIRRDPCALATQDGREMAQLRLLAAVVNAHPGGGEDGAGAAGGREVESSEEAEPPAPESGARPAPEEVSRRIRELAALRDDGLVTEEEFAAKKAELLKRL
ncbi:DUF4429 domain-containing protein [Nocardiopsis chromatogenes]|uniref:DUF4429 domain-containing protein n=1 Tax=Nocardiopsis chromatogenes TaxID=280239 RepID=UPI000476C739|nr:DUF4429 domain-containing protein [Nocardiopsis chromatogenes]